MQENEILQRVTNARAKIGAAMVTLFAGEAESTLQLLKETLQELGPITEGVYPDEQKS